MKTAILIFAMSLSPAIHAAEVPGLKPFLEKHCFDCHDADAKKGGLQLDALSTDFADKAAFAAWVKVFDKTTHGEMPPKKKARPALAELQPVMAALRAQLQQASLARQAGEGRVVYRRLNRVEYENTLHDLFSIGAPLKAMLPEDGVAEGFDNIGAALDVSSVQMEKYLEAADAALDAALAREGPVQAIKEHHSFLNNQEFLKQVEGKTVKRIPDGVVMFGSHFMPSVLRTLQAPAGGTYRVRVSAYAYQSDQPMTMVAYAGDLFPKPGEIRIAGFFDTPPNKPKVEEFNVRLERGDSLKVMPFRLAVREGVVRKEGAHNYKGPGLAVQWVEVEGPLDVSWPPPSHARLFGTLPLVPVAGAKAAAGPNQKGKSKAQASGVPAFVVTSTQPAADAEKLLTAFMPLAFRRPLTAEEMRPFAALVQAQLKQGTAFEEAMRVGYKAVLTSPGFLFLKETPGRLDDFAVAARLSYFLWSTMPDLELLRLANQRTLSKPEILRAQVERMLASPKARAFTANFLGQWLELRQIDFTTPDEKLYPEFDELLKVSMTRETESFFEELLKRDLSVRNFIQSDFTLLNQRLAEHYGIAGVSGQEFRKVALPAGSHRGGVLTHASVLKVTANGTTTSPVLRGKWVLDRIMGIPPEPPPKNVAAIEPDIRGATTIREQLDKHRNNESCAVCHVKIDPPGFALENFDVIGGWRENYRVLDANKRAATGPKIDASYQLADGRAFHDIAQFKSLLLKDPDQIARCLTGKLMTYATGAGIQFADRAVVDDIVARVKAKDYGLRSIVHEVVQSRVFLNK